MCFLTFDFELCEKLWQMLQVCPRSVLTMYFLKSSGVCRSREPPKISMPVICITTLFWLIGLLQLVAPVLRHVLVQCHLCSHICSTNITRVCKAVWKMSALNMILHIILRSVREPMANAACSAFFSCDDVLFEVLGRLNS